MPTYFTGRVSTFDPNAAPPIEITIDPGQLADTKAMLSAIPQGLTKVLYRALNDTGLQVYGKSVKAVKKFVGLRTEKQVKRYLWFKRANSKRLMADIMFARTGYPAIWFGTAEQAPTGAMTGGVSGEFVEGSFIAEMPKAKGAPVEIPHGHRGIFERTHRDDVAGMGTGKFPRGRIYRLPPRVFKNIPLARLPLQEVRSASATKAMLALGKAPEIMAAAGEYLGKRVAGQTWRLMRDARKQGIIP